MTSGFASLHPQARGRRAMTLAGTQETPELIVNADDFGASEAVNQAVALAHRHGVLTSASLMVAGDAAEEAVAMARSLPSLAVGLHLVLSDGPAVLSHKQAPHLVDAQGRIARRGPAASIQYGFSRQARRELAWEIASQFEAFARTGLPLAHVDGHEHLHLHPAVLPRVIALGKEFGAHGLRLPRDELRLALSYDRSHLPTKLLWAVVFDAACLAWRQRVLQAGFVITDRVYGLFQTGRMDEAYVLRLLASFRARTAELYLHPTTDKTAVPLGPNSGDLATLLSPAVRRIVETRGFRLTTYPAMTARRL